jgi:glycosyltransferase involved in cell wall biosynthesis
MTHTADDRELTRAGERRPRILFIASYQPDLSRPDTGGQQRLCLLHQAAQAVGDVTFIACQPWGRAGLRGYYADTVGYINACIAAAVHPDLSARTLPPDAPNVLAPFDLRGFDVIFVHRLCSAWWTALVDPARAIIDIDDLPSHALEQAALNGSWWRRPFGMARYRRVREGERRVLDHYRFGLICSDDDRDYLNHPRARVLANVFWPQPAMQQPPLVDPPGSLLFVGSLMYKPNVQGLTWFVQEVLPRVRQQLPDATLTVVGKCFAKIPAEWTWREAPGVRFVGGVPDVSPYIRDARAQVCPVLTGGGTRIKILESLAFGCPIVCTTFGAAGHRLDAQHGVYRHDNPAAFADQCASLLTDPAARAAARDVGRPFVHSHFSPDSFLANVRDMIQTIVRESPRV